ncbi:MAG: sn-glycerol-1-phosphate dehydrogenase [Alicyclobacillus sp.]|nr:sn-glycerol-1-phosphate dehydrogenase [Alicyclobacillus sp.]
MNYVKAAALRRVLVVADLNTYDILGKSINRCLHNAGLDSNIHVLKSDHDLLPDEQAISDVRQVIQEHRPEIILAVGSGVINDISRYASYQEGLPYMVVATAPSMDGYASSVAALQFNGVKITLAAQAPRAIFADPRILSEAPWELIQSGFGDLVGKVISLSDWKLSHSLYGENFCSLSYELVLTPVKYCIENASKLRSREPEAMKNLFIGLINSGIAMAMMGNSRPCSGSEHHCSHFWDLLAYKNQRQHASHGIQVGYATHWMIRFYQILTQLDRPIEPIVPELDHAWEDGLKELYGEGTKDILLAQQRKRSWLLERMAHIQGPPDMERIITVLQPELSLFPQAADALCMMGIPNTPGFLEVDDKVLRQTFAHAKELRERYTVFDFLEGQGILGEAIDRVMELS